MNSSNGITLITDLEPIDPARIPNRKLNSGSLIPAIGLGTFGSDHVSNEQIATAVQQAIQLGYRHIDCASVYGNEQEIGKALQKVTGKGLPREELWITSKLWNDRHGKGKVIQSCKQSLIDLHLDYLDLYLVHWPFRNFHPKGCDVTSRSPNAQAFKTDQFLETWSEMESLVDQGLARNIGTSNMTRAKLESFLPRARILPTVNEMELHPHFQQPTLYSYVVEQRIQPVGFCPIGSPARPERDRTPEDTSPVEDPVLIDIARKHGIHPATLCVKWAAQRGQIPIPFSTNPRNMLSNLKSLVSAPLTDEEMRAIALADRNCRLIKGQVFLWKDHQDWQDLWDEDGVIAR